MGMTTIAIITLRLGLITMGVIMVTLIPHRAVNSGAHHHGVLHIMHTINPGGIIHPYKQTPTLSNQLARLTGCSPQLVVHRNRILNQLHQLPTPWVKDSTTRGSNSEDEVSVEVPSDGCRELLSDVDSSDKVG